MSLSGNIYFGGQNLENSHPLESVQLDLDSIRHDISQNEIDIQENRNDIAQNVIDIQENRNDIAQNVIDIQENINSISTLQNQCTDISYNLSNDTTTIANRLKLAAPLDWAVGNGVNVPPHLQIDNTSVDVTNQYSTYIYTGVEHQVNLSSAIGQVGDTVICNSKQNSSANSKGIVLTGKFPSEERGLRIDLNNGQSKYKGGQFFMDCSQGTLQSLIVKGGLFIQGTPAQGGTQIDVGAYIYTIIPALTTRMTTAETDINNLETRMTTAETDVDNLETRMTTAETDVDNLEGRMTIAETDIDNLITDTLLLDYIYYDIPSSTLEFDSRLNILKNYDFTNKSMIFLITNTANNANFGISAGVEAGDYSANTRNNDILFLAKNDLLCTGLNIAKWETANSGMRISFDSTPTEIYSSDLEVNGRLILNELTNHDTTLTSHTSTLASHTTNISTNSTNISTNTTNISTNITNISTNTTNISTNTTNIATNSTNIKINRNDYNNQIFWYEDFLRPLDLSPGVIGISTHQWKNYSSNTSDCRVLSVDSTLHHPGITNLKFAYQTTGSSRTDLALAYFPWCWGDIYSAQFIFMIPPGQFDHKMYIGLSNSKDMTNAFYMQKERALGYTFYVNGSLVYTSPFDNDGQWQDLTIVRTNNGCDFIMKDMEGTIFAFYSYINTELNNNILLSPWITARSNNSVANTSLLLDYVGIRYNTGNRVTYAPV